MECGLHKADAGGLLLVGAIHDSLHELAAHAEILHGRVDGDGADAANHGAFVEGIAADDAAFDLGYDAVEVRSREQAGGHADGVPGRGEVAGEAMGGVEGGEGVVADLSADGRVFGCGAANDDFRLWVGWHAFVPF